MNNNKSAKVIELTELERANQWNVNCLISESREDSLD